MVGLAIDNGAETVKLGLEGELGIRRVPNCIARSKDSKRYYVGNELERCRDFGALSFRRPHEQGVLTSWQAQDVIWRQAFDSLGIRDRLGEMSLVLSEPVFNLPSVQDNTDEMVFEEYGFGSYLRVPTHSMVSASHPAECLMVVDSGFSGTTACPVVGNRAVMSAAKRLEVGGKFLTNHLKETISYRHYNVMDESYLLNEIKEKACFVSGDFHADLQKAFELRHLRSSKMRLLLPDYDNTSHVRILGPKEPVGENDQVLELGNERFTTPEILFHPDDTGLEQAGIHQTVAQSIRSAPSPFQDLLWANIVLVGGNACMPGLRERLETELRKLGPEGVPVTVDCPDDPIEHAVKSAQSIPDHPSFQSEYITKQQYQEHGVEICTRKWRRHANQIPE